ncbi:MAG: tetratricopeptide repeat protein [Coriobacteriia bacterium]
MKEHSVSVASRWCVRVAATGSVLTLLLVPLRSYAVPPAVMARAWDGLLHPGTAVGLALLFAVLVLLSSALIGLREKGTVHPLYQFVAVGILALVLMLSAYHHAANGILVHLDDAEGTNDPVVVWNQVGGLPSPYAIPGREGFWRAVRQVQVLRIGQLGYPTVEEEPFSTMYAELAQSSLGAGDMKGAQAARNRLLRLAPDSPLALSIAAKVDYASGDVNKSLSLIARARESENSESRKRLFDAMDAYYRAARFATEGANAEAAADLLQYAKLSFDPYVRDRVEADAFFANFIGTEDFEELTIKLQDVPTVERSPSSNQ